MYVKASEYEVFKSWFEIVNLQDLEDIEEKEELFSSVSISLMSLPFYEEWNQHSILSPDMIIMGQKDHPKYSHLKPLKFP